MAVSGSLSFQGHVEAGQVVGLIELGAGDVVDAVAALPDPLDDVLDPYAAGVVDLQSATCLEAAVVHDEDQGVERLAVLEVEGAVDEDVVVVPLAGHAGILCKERGRCPGAWRRCYDLPARLT